MRIPSLSLAGLGFALACGHVADEPSLGTVAQAVVNGAPSDASDDSALFVLTSPPGALATACTGTLIAPNLVATALHCVTYSEAGFFNCAADGSVTPGSAGDGAIGALVPASSVKVMLGSNPGRQPAAIGMRLFGSGSTQICRNDIAFVVLDQDLDAPISKVRLSGEVNWGDLVHVVGYGLTETSGTSGRYARDGVSIVDVGPVTDGEPTRTAAPRTFVVNEGPCHGDSGGPAFSAETGALLGVYSLAAGPSCTGVGVRNVYTSLAPFSSLAMAAFDAAGAEPLLEELEEEPEGPPVVAEQGCSIETTSSSAAPSLAALCAAWIAARLRRTARRQSQRD